MNEELKQYHLECALENEKKDIEQRKRQYLKKKRYYLEYRKEYYIKNKERLIKSNEKYRRAFNGIISNMHNGIISRCKIHNRCKKFSRDWFINFCNNSEELKLLYNNWIENNYSFKLSPSIDRINNRMGYSKSNIQFLTKGDNARKSNH